MDKVREAMELALKERWDTPSAPIARGSAARDAKSGTSRAHAAADPKDARLMPLRPAPAPARARKPGLARIRAEETAPKTLARNRLVAAIKDSRERESYCLLQAVVAKRLDELGQHVLGVTGPQRARGKTLTAANLAASLVLDGQRPAVLVDLDLRAPSVAKLFGVDVKPGLEECLFNGAAPEDALFSPSIEGLAVLPSRRGSRGVRQVLSSPNLKVLLGRIRASWPDAVVVLDLPPIAGGIDAGLIADLADAVLLVVEDGVTREADYRRVFSALGRHKVVGTVLNKAAGAG